MRNLRKVICGVMAVVSMATGMMNPMPPVRFYG